MPPRFRSRGGAAETKLDCTLIALADPTRRAILHRLSAGSARVTDVAQPFEISLNSVSKHIRILERARLVRRRKRGREHLLSLDPQPLHEVAAWMERQRTFWAQRLDALEAALKEEDRRTADAQRKRRRPA